MNKHLALEERKAIRLYKSDITPDDQDHRPPGYFEQLNAALRADSTSMPHQVFVVQHLDAALRRFVLAEPVSLHRGMGADAARLAELQKVGHHWVEKAYSSCTTEKYKAEEFARRSGSPNGVGLVLEIEIPAGTHVLPMTGAANDLEDEWLLPRGCRFSVLLADSRTGTDLLRHIRLKLDFPI